MQVGFDSYTEFAPQGWRPRRVAEDRGEMADLLSEAGTWARLALVDGRPVGHVSFFPRRDLRPGDPRHWSEAAQIPGLAHLWQLFVLPAWWGRGVAPALHDGAIAEMTARGFEQVRLYTPSAHTRARRFYERRGWSSLSEAWHESLQLMLTEYMRPLP